MPNAEKVVVLGDGAEWIKNLAELHFPEAIQIVDLYHTREHVSDLCKILFAPDVDEVVKYRIRWWDYLDEGNVERIAREAQKRMSDDPKKKGKCREGDRLLRTVAEIISHSWMDATCSSTSAGKRIF